MHTIQPGIVPQYVSNVQFCGLMPFIYGGAARGMGISSEKGWKQRKYWKRNQDITEYNRI